MRVPTEGMAVPGQNAHTVEESVATLQLRPSPDGRPQTSAGIERDWSLPVLCSAIFV